MLDSNKAIDDLLINGSTTSTCEILGGKLQVEFTSLTSEKRLKVEKALKEELGNSDAYLAHIYMIKLVSQALTKITYKEKTQEFKTAEESEAFIKTRPDVVIDALVKAHSAFEKEIKELLSPEKLENFSQVPSI